jgi:hypothetical protein
MRVIILAESGRTGFFNPRGEVAAVHDPGLLGALGEGRKEEQDWQKAKHHYKVSYR